ncbi:MAG: hypothetical protein KBC46_10890 [Ferrovibrio sp.]|nr:hypothetical protein [Ferrovibrio sp.]
MHPNLQRLNELRGTARHTLMQRFLDVAIALHPQERLPPRAALNPLAVADLLPHLVLTRVEYATGKPRFKLTVIGEQTNSALGLRLANRYMDEAQATDMPSLQYPIADREDVVREGLALYRYGPPRLEYRANFATIELCHTPMADDGTTVSHILSLTVFEGLTAAR